MQPTDGDVENNYLDLSEWALRDEEARTYVTTATETVASLVRSTLGPRGMQKMIRTWDHQGEPETVLTADGSEILAAIQRGDGFNHPVAALFVDAVDSMQRGLSDGTTTAIVLTAALIDRGVKLVDDGLHPTAVVVGYAMANSRTGVILDELARSVDPDPKTLARIAETSMTTDVNEKAEYARHVADVVAKLAATGDADQVLTDNVKVLTATDVEQTTYDGVVVRRKPGLVEESNYTESEPDVERSVPTPVRDATVAVLDQDIDFERTATTFGDGLNAGVDINSAQQLAAYQSGLSDRIAETVDRFRRLGVDVLVSRSEIDDPISAAFERENIRVVDTVQYPLSDIYRLARGIGGSVVSHPDDVTADTVGTAGRVWERRVGDELWTVFEGCDGETATLVLNAETESGAAEAERLVADALDVTGIAAMDRQVLPGGGAPAMVAADGLREYATSVPDREQLAIEAFADSLETVVSTLAENAGVDPLTALADLRAEHAGNEHGPAPIGLDDHGDLTDAWEAGIVVPRRVFSQAVETAYAATEQLLTVDTVLFPNVDSASFTPNTEHE